VPAELRGTTFGLLNLFCGAALLAASALAGWLWEVFAPRVTVFAGAGFTAAALLAPAFRGRDVGRLRGA
jgi:hypothetical protein